MKIEDYLSPHVFDGVRPIPKERAEQLRKIARKAIEDFTRVVDQTDPEARKEARQSKMHHDRAPTK